ncbi:unnamed protein product [Paramecium sonneborni]|uniref:Transmembrane protein n=1 Tax=Paramecium sonneborni TaxID=65129 RepID=A0A8S1PJK8_9CILI|nr:unnamed protein product [Paramecium sonneborni]
MCLELLYGGLRFYEKESYSNQQIEIIYNERIVGWIGTHALKCIKNRDLKLANILFKEQKQSQFYNRVTQILWCQLILVWQHLQIFQQIIQTGKQNMIIFLMCIPRLSQAIPYQNYFLKLQSHGSLSDYILYLINSSEQSLFSQKLTLSIYFFYFLFMLLEFLFKKLCFYQQQ